MLCSFSGQEPPTAVDHENQNRDGNEDHLDVLNMLSGIDEIRSYPVA